MGRIHPLDALPGRWQRSLATLVFLIALSSSKLASATPNTDTTWRERYRHAKTTLANGHPSAAAQEFAALADDAPTPADATLARELLTLARDTARRIEPGAGAHVRTSDELTVLYTSAFVYGLGTSTWVVLLTQPRNFALALVPFAAFTTSAVGGVAVIDDYRPFRRGVPHSIAAGLFLGSGEAVLAVGLQHAGASRHNPASRWGTSDVATAVWAGATAGGVVGGAIGYWREPTPGRVSFTTSVGIWSGLITGFAGAALDARDRARAETGFAAGTVGYNLGIVGGVMVAPLLAPSVARVRFGDLGTVAGGLLAGGTYAIATQEHATVRGGLGFAALGAASGFGLTWWLTRGMPGDPPKDTGFAGSMHAFVAPGPGGFTLGLRGAL
jgi:hypothetical protein